MGKLSLLLVFKTSQLPYISFKTKHYLEFQVVGFGWCNCYRYVTSLFSKNVL